MITLCFKRLPAAIARFGDGTWSVPVSHHIRLSHCTVRLCLGSAIHSPSALNLYFCEMQKRSSRYAAGEAFPAYRVAWAFFRAAGLSGAEFKPLDAKLQLYQYLPGEEDMSEGGAVPTGTSIMLEALMSYPTQCDQRKGGGVYVDGSSQA